MKLTLDPYMFRHRPLLELPELVGDMELADESHSGRSVATQAADLYIRTGSVRLERIERGTHGQDRT
jgi:hypothetical protein